MQEGKQFTDFSGGMNNIAQVNNLPANAVREISNMDPVEGGALQLRAGAQRILQLDNLRGGVEVNGDLIVVGDRLQRFIPYAGTVVDLGAAPDGEVAGASMNGDAFLNIGATMLRVRETTVGPWCLPEINLMVGVGAGALPGGVYRLAVTAVDQFAAETGCDPMIVQVADGSSITVSWVAPPGAVSCKVYASATNGETLYFQTTATGEFTLSTPAQDQTARLTTMNLQAPPNANLIASHKGRLLLAAGNVLWATEPFAVHLVNFATGYLAYESPITVVIGVEGGVYVATETRTWFVADFGTTKVQQAVVLEVGAVPGSGVLLPDGRATWITRYGQAFGSPTGALELPQRNSYAPVIASHASAGVVDHNGVQMVVTNLKGATNTNSLGVEDFFDMEIE
jgi:hypothetical protein